MVEYLLDRNRTRLNELSTLALNPLNLKGPVYFGELRAKRNSLSPCSLVLTTCAEKLKTLISSLSQLRSLTFTIRSKHISWGEGNSEEEQLRNIQHAARLIESMRNIWLATRLIKSIKSVHMQEIRVEFTPGLVTRLGSCLPLGAQPMEVCKVFEEALLAYPCPCIRFHDAGSARRAGRFEFWSAAIKRTFPRLGERGLLIFPDRKFGLLGCCYPRLTARMAQPNQTLQTQLGTKHL